jgi:hypothetical protein|nr:hypothetical protein [Kofleriaceae bacterium]
MTKMSEPRSVTCGKNAPNRAQLLRESCVVRRVHRSAPVLYLVIALGLLLAACVIPPSLSVDTGSDSLPDSPPAITSISADQQTLVEPGLVVFGVNQQSTAIVSVTDTDIDDPIHVRWFVDYSVDNPLPPRVQCDAAPNGEASRTASCLLNTVCVQNDIGKQHLLEVAVFDRDLADGSGEPLFQFMAGSGGMTTNEIFQLQCQAQ